MRRLIDGEMVVVRGSQVDSPVKATGSRLRAPQKWSCSLSLLWKVWRPPLSAGRVGSLGVGMKVRPFSSISSCAGVRERTELRFEVGGVTFLPHYQFNCVSQYLNITLAVRGVQWMLSLGWTLNRRGLISDRKLYLLVMRLLR